MSEDKETSPEQGEIVREAFKIFTAIKDRGDQMGKNKDIWDRYLEKLPGRLDAFKGRKLNSVFAEYAFEPQNPDQLESLEFEEINGRPRIDWTVVQESSTEPGKYSFTLVTFNHKPSFEIIQFNISPQDVEMIKSMHEPRRGLIRLRSEKPHKSLRVIGNENDALLFVALVSATKVPVNEGLSGFVEPV